jgi:hypothetical protein
MTGYSWSISEGGTIKQGDGTNAVIVNWNSAGARTLSVNYVDVNGCTATTAVVKNVTVSLVPGNAGSIAGTTDICAGTQGVVYSIPTIPYAVTYKWVLPVGATIVSGDGTPEIKVNFAANASSGNIYVYGYNLCEYGKGANLAIKVTPEPKAAGSITSQSTFGLESIDAIFSVDSIPNATKYNWNLPKGADIISGFNTNTISVNFKPGTISGIITVSGSNSCHEGIVSPAFRVIPHEVQFEIYPVPSDGLFTTTIRTPEETTFIIRVYDHLGHIILEVNNARTISGIYERIIDIRPSPSGIYYIEFLNSKFKETRKVLVNR